MTDVEHAAVLRRLAKALSHDLRNYHPQGTHPYSLAIDRAIKLLAKERHICPTCGEYG